MHFACGTASEFWRRACRGSKVAVEAPNGIDGDIACLAVVMGRVTPALIKPAYTRPQIDVLLEIAAPRLVLAPAALGGTPAPDQAEWLLIDDAARYASDPGSF